ncbi:hypothetical protein WJX74_001096 [Apatococcus lobatus]|uniref:PRKR-interacting protein 1 n=1 Tax=Apatococcus lobatus TaxID=904363 RepID=A0AAW1SAM9_9CHLO
MALQIVPGSSTDLVLATRRPEISQEEHERRLKDAEELEKKLTYITEKVPTRIQNVMGSNAGAGSGEFHMYRQARRREMMRQARFETEAIAQAEKDDYEMRQQRLREQEDTRTAKRKQKREKKRARKKRAVGPGECAADDAHEDSEEDDGVQAAQAALD